jgi:methylthioribose-1-phosphate isomerase
LRPLLKRPAHRLGARRLGIPTVAVDGAGAFLMARGEVDAVILGADRVCANGDVVNKVGSYAALGPAAGIRSWSSPGSTVDDHTATGADVESRTVGRTRCSRSPGNAARRTARAVSGVRRDPAPPVTAIVTDAG